MIRVHHLDHLVLTVKNVPATVRFYETVLGMQAQTFAQGRTALTYGEQKINLHQVGKEFEPKANRPQSGSADLCFIIEQDLDVAIAHLKTLGVAIIEGPIERTGATGAIISVYFRDPDGNLIEISNLI